MTCELDKLKQKHIDEIINIFQKGKISEKESHLCLKYMTKAVEDVCELVFKIMREEQPCYASELARTLAGEADTNISGQKEEKDA